MAPRAIKNKRRQTAASDRKKKTDVPMPHLDELVVFSLLSWLPAMILRSSMTLVCKTWSAIIGDPNFAKVHQKNARPGLFIQNTGESMGACFLEADGNYERAKMSSRYPAEMFISSGGFAIFANHYERKFFIGNPFTEEYEAIAAPMVVSTDPTLYTYAIIRDPFSGVYRLVWAVQNHHLQVSFYVQKVGVDEGWRKINKDVYLTYPIFHADAMAIGRFLYWTNSGERDIFFMDSNDEEIHQLRIPRGRRTPLKYLQMSDSLSTITAQSPRNSVFYIHVLKDPLARTWVLHHKLDLSISCELPRKLIIFLDFVGYANNNEDLIIRALRGLGTGGNFAYSIKTKRLRHIGSFMLPRDNVKVHTNVLVPLGSLFGSNE